MQFFFFISSCNSTQVQREYNLFLNLSWSEQLLIWRSRGNAEILSIWANALYVKFIEESPAEWISELSKAVQASKKDIPCLCMWLWKSLQHLKLKIEWAVRGVINLMQVTVVKDMVDIESVSTVFKRRESSWKTDEISIWVRETWRYKQMFWYKISKSQKHFPFIVIILVVCERVKHYINSLPYLTYITININKPIREGKIKYVSIYVWFEFP